jgi:putative transposase
VSHTYQSVLVHCVFATKDRRACISADLQPRLHDFLGGCARQIGAQSLRVGGTEDHVHILLRLPGTMALATAMQKLKANSSRWVHETFPDRGSFAWQEGYGAFSVSISQAAKTVAYIDRQQEHHQSCDLAAEWTAFVKKHGLHR